MMQLLWSWPGDRARPCTDIARAAGAGARLPTLAGHAQPFRPFPVFPVLRLPRNRCWQVRRPLDNLWGVKTIPVRHWLSVVAVVLLTGCAAPRNSVTQIAAIDALLPGAYDGQSGRATRSRRTKVG